MYQFKHNLAVVIPTKGRATLRNALESLTPENQGGYSAEIIIVYDMSWPRPDGYMTRAQVSSLRNKYNIDVVGYDAGYSDWGYPQLRYGYHNLVQHSEYIMNIGDDDVMVEGIIPKMLKVINANGIKPYMFQAELWP